MAGGTLASSAHDKAFLFYGGVCRRGIYDNMKTAVDWQCFRLPHLFFQGRC